MKRFLSVVALSLLVMASSVSTARAQETYAKTSLRVWGGAQCRCVLSDNDTFADPVFGTAGLEASKSTFGLGGDIQLRPVKLFSLDLGVGYSRTTVDFSHTVGAGVQSDKLGMLPLFIGASVHVVSTKKVDVHVGYLAVYMVYLNDLNYSVPGVGNYGVATSNEFTPKGFSAGFDVATSDKWGINFDIRMVNADGDSNHLVALDPTFITVGVTRKF